MIRVSRDLTEQPMCEHQNQSTLETVALREEDGSPTLATSDRLQRIARSQRLETFKRAFWVALIPGAILFMAMQIVVHARANMIGVDSHAYWMAIRSPESWYTRPPASRDAFLYSPAFAQALWPLGRLPWLAFQALWIAGQAGVMSWLLAPLGWRHELILAPFFITEVLLGNIYLFFAGALVVCLGRTPGALALPILTKITPGIVGVWFVVRREWRATLCGAGFTMLIVAVSAAFAPAEWVAWAHFLANSARQRGDQGMVVLRLAAALGIVIWAARTGRAWLLAPALILACPIQGGFGPVAVLTAIPRLLQFEHAERAAKAFDAPHRRSQITTVETFAS